jgi:uracil-DNA glycosylase family 4
MENYKMLYNPQCDSCPLHEEATNVCIPARTTRSKCKYLFVGHHPDQAEDKGGTAGDGAAYALFQKALRLIEDESDLDIESIVYTNAVKCYTGEGKKPGVKAKRECQRYLQAEVEEYKPDVIIALGGSALSTITDGEYGAVGPNRLKVLSAFDTPLCVTLMIYMPTPSLRSGRKTRKTLRTFKSVWLIPRRALVKSLRPLKSWIVSALT